MVVQLNSPGRSRPSLFSDFHKDMTQNPISEDLAIKRDEEAVKEAIKNLIAFTTPIYESTNHQNEITQKKRY